jgi:predicted anti-sigma-YlaC factor YlaD
MHRIIEDHLEDVLSGALPAGHQVSVHLKECGECREETNAMLVHSQLLHAFKAPAELEPRAGFYARVLERIEFQRPVSIWALFTDSIFGRRLAMASLAVAMLMGLYVVSSEEVDQNVFVAHSAVEMDPLYPGAGFTNAVMTANAADSGAVLMSLVSYQER